VAVTPTNGYCDGDELKAALNIPTATATDDVALTRAIDTASRAIDRYCGRRFWADTEDVVRYFTARDANSLTIAYDNPGDYGLVAEPTEVAIDRDGDHDWNDVYVLGDAFDVEPKHAVVANGAPYTRLVILLDNDGWPVGVPDGVRVTGRFGYPTTPPEIIEATLIQASRIFKRVREAPFGIAGVTFDGGGVRLLSRLDADVEMLVRPYRTGSDMGFA